jgi:phage terminase large subunit
MQGDFTRYFERLIKAYNSGYRRIVSMGGTSSSKTYSELQLLYQIAIARHLKKRPVVISVVSESLPHLKLGAIRDFEGFLRRKGLYDDSQIDHTNHKYYFGDSFIEFFAADIGKATGPRRNILLLNEVNNIPLPVVRELVQRTDETIFYDFNPTEDFWISEEVFTLPSREFILLKSNHLDNDYLSPAIRREIELRRIEIPITGGFILMWNSAPTKD